MIGRLFISVIFFVLAGCATESEVLQQNAAYTLHSHLTPKVLALCIDGNASKTTLLGSIQSRIMNIDENTLEVIVGSGETAHVIVRISAENSGAKAEFHYGRMASWLTDSTYSKLSAGCE